MCGKQWVSVCVGVVVLGFAAMELLLPTVEMVDDDDGGEGAMHSCG